MKNNPKTKKTSANIRVAIAALTLNIARALKIQRIFEPRKTGFSPAIKNLRTGLPKGYNNMPILNQKTFLIDTPYNNIMQKGENSSFKIINLATASRECSKK